MSYEIQGQQSPNPIPSPELALPEVAVLEQPHSIMDRLGNTKIGVGIAIAAASVALAATNAKEVFARGDSDEPAQAQASARTPIYEVDAYGGTEAYKKHVQRASVGDPVQIEYLMPSTYRLGVLTPVTIRLKYQPKTKFNLSGYNKRNYPTYGKIFGKNSIRVKSFSMTTRTTPGLSALENQILNEDGNFDRLYNQVKRNSFRLRPGKTKTMRMHALFDNCQQWPVVTTPAEIDDMEFITGFRTPPADYKCTPANVYFNLKGSISKRRSGVIYRDPDVDKYLTQKRVKIITE